MRASPPVAAALCSVVVTLHWGLLVSAVQWRASHLESELSCPAVGRWVHGQAAGGRRGLPAIRVGHVLRHHHAAGSGAPRRPHRHHHRLLPPHAPVHPDRAAEDGHHGPLATPLRPHPPGNARARVSCSGDTSPSHSLHTEAQAL